MYVEDDSGEGGIYARWISLSDASLSTVRLSTISCARDEIESFRILRAHVPPWTFQPTMKTRENKALHKRYKKDFDWAILKLSLILDERSSAQAARKRGAPGAGFQAEKSPREGLQSYARKMGDHIVKLAARFFQG